MPSFLSLRSKPLHSNLVPQVRLAPVACGSAPLGPPTPSRENRACRRPRGLAAQSFTETIKINCRGTSDRVWCSATELHASLTNSDGGGIRTRDLPSNSRSNPCLHHRQYSNSFSAHAVPLFGFKSLLPGNQRRKLSYAVKKDWRQESNLRPPALAGALPTEVTRVYATGNN